MKTGFSILFSALFLCASFSLLAQCDGDIILETQEDVDNFASNYGCDVITGDLIVGNAPWPEISNISNLEGLSIITNVTGSLGIRRNIIRNLEGLENLISVGGELIVGYNDSLTVLQGLENLDSIGIGLIIIDNDALVSLHGMQNLTSIDGYLEILYNGAITSLEGLENLTSVGQFNINSNHDLISLDGLENLATVGASLNISENDGLTTINGLESLTSIGGTLIIADTPELIHVEGLQNLTSVGNTLLIAYCDTLTTIEGFQSLTSVGKIDVFENPNLDMCCSMLNFEASAGAIYIGGNKPSCNSIEEITTACMETSTQNIDQDLVNLYPNPSNGLFRLGVSNSTPFSLQILNSRGEVVLSNSSKQHEQDIDLSNEPNGLYFVRINLDDNIYSKKFVKQ